MNIIYNKIDLNLNFFTKLKKHVDFTFREFIIN